MRLLVLSLSLFVACSTTPPAAETPPVPNGAPDEPAAEAPAEATTEAAAEGEEAGGEADAGMDLPDVAKLEEAKGLARAMMPKAALMEAVKPVLGEPTTMSDSEAVWMARAGDACKAMKVSLMGDMVGNVSIEDAPCPGGEAAAGTYGENGKDGEAGD